MSNGEGRSSGGFGIDREASVLLIVSTALTHGVSDPNQIAYMLATAQHETRDFAAPEEDYGRSQARKLGYSGGEEFYGRGYVHLTHDYNYKKFDELLGLDGELVRNPERAKEPELAAQILVIGMRDGLFTGRRLDRYLSDAAQDTYNARRVVNGITRQSWTIKAAEDCERYAAAWAESVPMLIEQAKAQTLDAERDWSHDLQDVLQRIVPRRPVDTPVISNGLPDYLRVQKAPPQSVAYTKDLQAGARGDQVRDVQLALQGLGIRDGLGRPLQIDGIFGASTRQAVENFQLWNGPDITGVADSGTRSLLLSPADHAEMPRPTIAGQSAPPAPSEQGPRRNGRSKEHGATASGSQPSLDPANPSHPDHAMYKRIRAGVRVIDQREGRPFDEASERISRSLLARCKGAAAGTCTDTGEAMSATTLQRVDHVLMGCNGNVLAIQGRLDDPAHRRVAVSVAEAALVPVEESDRRLDAANSLGARPREFDGPQAAMPHARPVAQGAYGMAG